MLSFSNFLNLSCIFTAGQRSCGKVMFSQASVILFGERGWVCLKWCHHVSLAGGGHVQGVGMSRGGYVWGRVCRGVGIRDPMVYPPHPTGHRFWDTHPHQYWHLVAATQKHTVGKWAVRILLACFLVAPCVLILSADPGTEGTDTWNGAKYLFVDKYAYCTIPSIDMESTFW